MSSEQPVPNVPDVPSVRQKTEDELRTLALDLVGGLIFTSLHLEDPSDVTMVFPMILLMDDEGRKAFLTDCILIYEYLSEAGPRSVNGYPNFLSVKKLGRADYERFRVIYKEALAMRKSFLNPTLNPTTPP